MVDDSGAIPFCSSHSYSFRVNFSEMPPKRNSSPFAVFTVISFSDDRLFDSVALILSNLIFGDNENEENIVTDISELHSHFCSRSKNLERSLSSRCRSL